MNGTLSLVSTPIGNLGDISERAIETLFASDVIICEDTRRTGILLSQIKQSSEKHPLLISYYDEVEEKRLPEIIERLESGEQISLISDNGTPTISDPGYRLVHEARKRGIRVTAVPGPSAVITALSLSGLPTNRFTFLGFLPEKQGPRIQLLNDIHQANTSINATIVVYCAPHKLQQTLHDILHVFGDIHLTVARELTKVHEEIVTEKITVFLEQTIESKGEYVLLFR